MWHAYPLPYHKNGFDAAQAALVIENLAAPTTSRATLATALFRAQDLFETPLTSNISQLALYADVFAPIAAGFGVGRDKFLSHMQKGGKADLQARVAWKYGAARGLSGTPTFAANGVVVDELAGWDLAQWKAWLAGS